MLDRREDASQIDWQDEFDRWAVGQGYGLTYDRSLAETQLHSEVFSLVQQVAPIQAEDTILDLACGSGLAGTPFIDAGCILSGIDFSPKMLELARGRGYTSTDVVNLKERTDPLEGVYDFVLAIGVAEDYVSVSHLVHLASESIGQGALFVVSCPGERNLSELLADSGMSPIVSSHFDFAAKGAVNQQLELVVSKREDL